MSIQFPDAPAQGESFVATNGVSYTYDNGGWIANSQSALDDRFVDLDGDTMTGDLTVPNLESAGDIQSTSQNGGPLAGFRNQLQNGLFQIRQRGDSFTAPADEYTFDRWWMGNAAGRTVAFVKEGPFMSAILITNNTSDNVFLRQGIEIQQGESGPFVQGTTWTLSLWSDSSSWVGRNLGVCAFRDAGKMNDSSGQRGQTTTSFVATGETNGVYKRYALQITIDTLPAATHEMFCIGLSLPSGGHRITGVQLEPGPVATPMEIRPIQTELALCKRYYNFFAEKTFYGMPMARLNSNCCSLIFWPEMRTAPTVTFEGDWKWRETGKSSPNLVTTPELGGYGSKLTGAAICTETTTINHGNWLETGKLMLDAEL